MNSPTLRIGTWLSIGSSAVAELAGMSGYDWLLFDLEHGCQSEAALPDQLRAMRGSSTKAIVRVGAPHADLISRVLDWGADGIMVPHVNSAAQAEHTVQAAHYAPRGHRGVARTVRACDYGLKPPPTEGARPIIMAQIETVEAVKHVDEIAGVNGINVLFVGPADLQYDLAHHADPTVGDYASCLQKVSSAAQKAGITAGILLRELSDVPSHRKLGFSHIAVDSDLSILRKAWQHTLSNLSH
jgi:2-dehydro-3-deoxyglucarate aldolase/4-hydroxy-2-oxoheptanedioate aldolase